MSGSVSQRARDAVSRIMGQDAEPYSLIDHRDVTKEVARFEAEVTAPLLAENEALKARVAQLEGSLGPFAFAAKNAPNINRRPHDFVLTSEFEAARAALEGGCDGQG